MSSRVKRIGLVGYYGHGNFGDELFLEAFRRVFPGGQYSLSLLGRSDDRMRRYPDSRLEGISEKFDAILIGGGDLFIPGYDVSNQYFLPQYLELPVFIHGVGVPTWTGFDKDVCERMKQFVQSPSVKSICVRDEESAKWIEKHLKPKVPTRFSDDIVFSLADTLDFHHEKKPVERIGIVMRGGQNKPDCQMKDFVQRLISLGHSVRFLMLGTGKELDFDWAAVEKLDCLDSQYVDAVVRSNDVDLLHAFDGVDMVYSMKFHGCVSAIMHGIPTVALITTDKFVNLYKKLGLQKFIIHHTSPDLFNSVELADEWPELNIAQPFLSSTSALLGLRAGIDALLV